MFRSDEPGPLVFAVIADESGAGPEVLSVDVKVATTVEVRP
jgi:hypothetical protein